MQIKDLKERETLGYQPIFSISNQRAERILIVDDEPAVRDIVARLVGNEGFIHDMAENGEEALQRLKENGYDLVLTDVQMPVMDGKQLLRHLCANCFDVAVIMVTGMADTKLAIECLTLGAYDYVIKPLDLEELLYKISRALERRKLILENKEHQRLLERRVQEQTADLQMALRKLEISYTHTLETLIHALDVRERETQRHSKRVSEYTMLLTRGMGVPESKWIGIERGSLLHDIGKIGISDNILLKPGKLTEEEWGEMRKHPEIGYNLLEGVEFLQGEAQFVLQHHERFDGTGYPQRLAGEQILLGARIFAVIDTFDAMTSDRPYRKALSYAIAREEIIRYSGKQFDPQVVKCFLDVPEQIWFKAKESLRF